MSSTGEALKQYEFNAAENEVIGGLAGAMRVVAIFNALLGVIIAIPAVLALLGTRPQIGPAIVNAIQAIVFVAIGFWLSRSAASFRAIVATQGQDVAHLMSALGDLRRIYGLQRALIILAIVVIGVAVIIMGVAMR